METQEVLKDIPVEQLEAALKERKKQEKEEAEKKRKEYESNRDDIVQSIMQEAVEYNSMLRGFKETLHELFTKQEAVLNEYGGIRGNSKGGFSLVHSSGEFKVTRTRSTQPVWDERSQKAVELISDFLKDTVKKRDQKLFEILFSFIQKNEKGDLEFSKVMHLFSHRDKYDDPRWVKGLNLIQESYSIILRGFGYDFFVKDNQGKWVRIDINFSAL